VQFFELVCLCFIVEEIDYFLVENLSPLIFGLLDEDYCCCACKFMHTVSQHRVINLITEVDFGRSM